MIRLKVIVSCLIVVILLLLPVGGDWSDRQRIRGAHSSYYKGWKVLVHDPSEFPEVSKKGIFVGMGKEVSVR